MENVVFMNYMKATRWKTQQSLALHISLNFQLPGMCWSVSDLNINFNINTLCSVYRGKMNYCTFLQQTSILILEFTWIRLLLTQSIVALPYLKFMNFTTNSYIIQVSISELLFLSIMHEAEYIWYLTELDWLSSKETRVLFCIFKGLFHLTKSVKGTSDVSKMHIKFQNPKNLKKSYI